MQTLLTPDFKQIQAILVPIKLSAGNYGVTVVSDASTGDTLARRKTSGAIQANSYIIGGDATYEILAESSGTLTFKTLHKVRYLQQLAVVLVRL